MSVPSAALSRTGGFAQIPAPAQTSVAPSPPAVPTHAGENTAVTDAGPSVQGHTQAEPDQNATPDFTDTERSALRFTAYDLDLRLDPATAGLTARARITVRNTGAEPLRHIGLQVSSTLSWDSITLAPAGTSVPFAQHALDTDADHTGKATEAVLTLPTPLPPGGSLTLGTFYSGTVGPSAERLTRIGASDAVANATDWDAITPGGTFLRGFGDVLWYPVSAPQLFLGEGARLFDAIDDSRADEQASSVRLRLGVAYTGDAPTAAYFCGRRAVFTAVSDTPDAPTAMTTGIATADFPAEPLGVRTPSLFVVNRPEVLSGPLAGELAGGRPMLAVVSDDPAAAPTLGTAAEGVAPLLQKWLGALPLSALTVLDPPRAPSDAGSDLPAHRPLPQPFEDGPLLVAVPATLTTSDATPALTFSLTHAWVQSGRPWIDEGLAQFFALLDVEQRQGRDAMIAQFNELMKPVVAAEAPAPSETDVTTPGQVPNQVPGQMSNQVPGQALITARSAVFYRSKAAAVWLMLRGIVGDDALALTLQAWRRRPPDTITITPTADAVAFERMLERNSGKDLHGFFADWILADAGLPDLSVTEVIPRQLPLTETGHNGGWLTVVTVHNAGTSMANVPVVVSSGSFSTTMRLEIPGATAAAPGSATVRVQTETAPTEVQVNDGTTPELRTSIHRREVRSK